MTLAYHGKSRGRRTLLASMAMLAILIAVAGGLALKTALAGTPTSGDKSDIKGATFSVDPTLSQASQMVCDGSTASSFTSAVNFTLSAPSPAGGFFVFYLTPNNGSNANPIANVPMNEVQVGIGGLAAGAHSVPFTLPVTHPFTATTGGILIVFSDDVGGDTWTAKSNSLNCSEATPSPDVSVAKSDNVAHSTAAGGTFNWVLTATVSGATTTASASITDTIPAGMTAGTYVLSTTGTAGKLSCSPTSGNNVSCTLASGAAVGTYTVTIPVTAPAANVVANCKLYPNTGHVTGGGGTNTTASSEDDVTVTGCAAPSVTFAKTHTPAGDVAAGGTFHWFLTATVSNGPTTQATSISDIAPAGMTFGAVAKSGTGTLASFTGNASGSPVAWTIASGAGNGTYVLDITVTAPAANNTDNCRLYTNTADETYGTTPPNPASDGITVTGCANPGISLLKTDNVNGTVAAGGAFNWIITATISNGPTTHAFVVSDTAPAGMTFGTISTTGGTGIGTLTCNASGSPVACTLASGATNGTYIITVAVTAPASTPASNCSTYTNTASIDLPEAAPITSSDNVAVTGCTRTVQVIKRLADGSSSTQTFEYTVTNDSSSPHMGLHVSTSGNFSVDVLQESAADGRDVVESVPSGWILDGYFVIQDSGDGAPGRCFPNPPSGLPALTDTASILGDGKDYLVCMVNHPVPPIVEVDPPTAVKTVDTPSVAGGRLHWLIEINNDHANPADQVVTVTDAGAQLDSVTPSGDASDCGSTPNTSGSFSCSVLATHDIFLHVSKPIPTLTTQQQCQGADFTNSASATFNVVGAAPASIAVDNSNTTIHVPADTTQCPGPQLSKTAVGFSNGTATWTISVANNGTGAVSRTVVITDTMATLVGGTPAGCSGSLATGLTCIIAGGAALTFDVQATGLTTACLPGSVSNSASATVDRVNIGGSPTGAVSITIPADTSKCTTPVPVCTTGCTVVLPTPTIVPPTPTAVPPTATPIRPTNTATAVDTVAGAKTPGPTPIAPSTGSGLFGTSGNSTNTLLALLGLFALSGGLAIVAVSRRRPRD